MGLCAAEAAEHAANPFEAANPVPVATTLLLLLLLLMVAAVAAAAVVALRASAGGPSLQASTAQEKWKKPPEAYSHRRSDGRPWARSGSYIEPGRDIRATAGS